MKDYNFILFHKAIDNVGKAYTSVDKAKTELIGSVYEADYAYEEDVALHGIRYKMELAKCLLKEIEQELIRLDRPT